MKAPVGLASPMVLVGPYRELLNAPATVWLPYRAGVVDPAKLMPMIFNDLTGRFEVVLPVPGGAAPRVDLERKRVGFDVQALGVFALVVRATNPR